VGVDNQQRLRQFCAGFGGAAQALKPKTQPARVKFISALFARQRVDSGAFDVPVDTTLDMSPNPSLDRL
jgi:hypothetical protein